MINISSGAATCVPENYWVSSNPSFVALESTNQKQFWDRETNPTTSTLSNTSNSYGIPYINPTTSIFGCNNTLYSSSFYSPTLGQNITPFSQVSNYSPTNFLKKEGYSYSVDGENYVAGGGIGLNLGHRTYFSSRDKEVTDRIFRRPRGSYQTNQVPRCQAEGCKIDLSKAKHYHKRHKVCEFHSKATRVVAAGLEQRFCQQCSRFHVLAEFDEAKRSCRKRLADHNRRRRKPQPGSSESRSAKASGNAFPQVCSIASRAELKETSLSSSTLPLMISNNKTSNNKDDVSASTSCVKETVTNGPALSLGGEEHQISYSATHQQPFIFNKNSLTTLFQRESLRSVSPYHNLLISTSNEAPPQSTGGWLDMTQQHPEDLQNLLHLGQAMFEVEFL